MSGRWVPPRKGSLRIQRSPGRCSASRIAATASGIEPRWTGMCSACITSSPRASKSAVEQSRRSLMLDEWAERTSTAPISSQAARRAPISTWSVTGSRRAQPRLAPPASATIVPAASTSRRPPAGQRRASSPAARRCTAPRPVRPLRARRAAPSPRPTPRRSGRRRLDARAIRRPPPRGCGAAPGTLSSDPDRRPARPRRPGPDSRSGASCAAANPSASSRGIGLEPPSTGSSNACPR